MTVADKSAVAWRWVLAGFFLSFSWSIAISQLFLGVSAILFVADIFARREFVFLPGEKLLYALAGAFVLWGCFSGLVNGEFLPALSALRGEWLFLAVGLCARGFGERIWCRRYFIFAAIPLATVGLLACWQAVFGPTFAVEKTLYKTVDGYWRAAGLFHSTMTFGNFAAVCAVASFALAVRGRETFMRIAASALALILGVATVLTYTRGSIFALGIGLVAVALLSRGRLRVGLAIGILAVGAGMFFLSPGLRTRTGEALSPSFVDERARAVSRQTVWSVSARIVAENPIFGVGPAGFPAAYERVNDSVATVTMPHAHNDILHAAATTGLVGALLFLCLWGVAQRLFWRRMHDPSESEQSKAFAFTALCGSLAFLAASMTEATFVDEEVRAALMILWGLGIAKSRSGAAGNSVPGASVSPPRRNRA